MDIKHIANASKDRTGLFMGNPDFIISNVTGQRILNWCKSGKIVESVKTEIPKVQNNEESNSIKQPEKEWFPFIDTDFENQNPPNIETEIIKPVIIYKSNYLRNGNNNAINAS